MRPRNHCERCAKKLHSGAVHCVACGGRAVPRREGRSRIVTGAIVTALSLIIVLAVGLSDRYVPAVSDWYSRMVIHHAPEGTMPYLPGVTGDDRAFYSCARTVVRKVENERSVVTFPGAPDQLTALGEGRFELRSYMDEATEEGDVLRRSFTCILQQVAAGGQWRVEEVEIEGIEEARARVARRD